MDRSADNLGQIINDIQRDLEELKTTQLRVREELYPIGSIYMSATLSTPEQVAEIYGGVWEAWGSGKVPVGVDVNDTDFATAGLTGGEKTHTLITDEIPAHSHTAKGWADVTDGSGNYRVLGASGASSDYSVRNAGGGQAHNNLQPYITCYMYRRVE